MATNQYNNAVHITKAALAVIEADATLLKHVRRDDKEFAQDGSAQAGSTRNIRVPGYGVWREGKVAQPSALQDTYIPVTVQQGGADFVVTSSEIALNIDDLQQIIRPRIATVVNQLDYELWQLVKQIPIVTGTPGTRPTALLPFADARALSNLIGGAPKDGTHAAVLHELAEASVVDGLKSLFNPTSDIAKQYKEGNMGYASGMAWSSDRNAYTHTSGVWAGSPVMNGATADGATQFVTSTWTSSPESTLNAGDVYTVDGVYAVDPVSKKSNGVLKQWCVKTTVTSSGGAMTIVNTETLNLTGPFQNVNAVPLTSARVRPFFPAAGGSFPQSVVFHPDGLVFASAVLPDMGQNCVRMKAPELNLSIRCYEYTDGRADEKLWRLDVLRGVALGRPGFAGRISS